jgi:hypothetical protein
MAAIGRCCRKRIFLVQERKIDSRSGAAVKRVGPSRKKVEAALRK